MIRKCRDMERVMAASSQKLLHGGMRTRDWFSDRLNEEMSGQELNGVISEILPMRHLSVECSGHLGVFLHKALPVESIAHFNGDQHRQGHGHGRRSLKDLALNAGKVLILVVALHEVRLHRRKR